jgi:hypothetical protein
MTTEIEAEDLATELGLEDVLTLTRSAEENLLADLANFYGLGEGESLDPRHRRQLNSILLHLSMLATRRPMPDSDPAMQRWVFPLDCGMGKTRAVCSWVAGLAEGPMRRTSEGLGLAISLALALCWSMACGWQVGPTFTVLAPIDTTSQPPVVFVSTNDLRDRVEASLVAAGFTVTQMGREASLYLKVEIGLVRSSGNGCGLVRNVRYTLRQFGTDVVAVTARGATGDCSNNILNQMSQGLAEQVLAKTAPGAAPAAP